MKIAYLTPAKLGDQRAWSGLSHYMAQSLISAGLEVEILHTLRVPMRLLPQRFLTHLAYKTGLRRRHLWLYDKRVVQDYARQMAQKLSKVKADVIFSSGTLQMAYLKSSRPIVFWTDATFANLVDYYFSPDNLTPETLRSGHETERAAIHNAAMGIYSSEWGAESAISEYQGDPQRIQVVPFGANIQNEPSDEEVAALIQSRPLKPCRLLLLSVDWMRKGADVAIKVAQMLTQQGVACELSIVGCQPPPGTVLPPNVKILGFIDKRNPEGGKIIQKMIAESHFMLLPSRADCSPIVVCEANAFGVPILTTDVGGIPNIVRNGLNGFCEPFDESLASRLTQHVIDSLSSLEKYRAFAESTRREYLSRLNWKVNGQRVRALIEKL